MAFHRGYPVRTYQSLVEDLVPSRKPHRRPRTPHQPRIETDRWKAMRKKLMRKTLEELLRMAEVEGVDMSTIIRKDSKGHVINAIVRLTKEREGAR